MERKKFSANFKALVALDALKDNATMPALARKHGVHPTQIKTWEKTLIDKANNLFSKKEKVVEDQSAYIAALERKTGQLALENDFLKKNLTKYPKEREQQ